MPPIGMILGQVSLADRFINLGSDYYTTLKAAQDAKAPTLNYGLFINNILGCGFEFARMHYIYILLRGNC